MTSKDDATNDVTTEVHKEFASLIKDLHDGTESLIRRQWHSQMIAGLMMIVLILIASWVAFYFMRGPGYGPQLAALEESSQRIQSIAMALAKTGTGCTDPEQKQICEDFQNEIGKYANDYKAVISGLNENDRQPKPEAFSITQLVGGTAVLAVLGYLGLMRLQNLDQELHNLRTFMFEQITTRVTELKEIVKYDVIKSITENIRREVASDRARLRGELDEARVSVQEELNGVRMSVQEISSGTKEEINKSKHETLRQIQDVQEGLSKTLTKYPWLDSPELREGLATLDEIPSVEKAHDLATELTEQQDEATALTVLKTIVERTLPGDKDDFHNAHSQCMRLNNPTLALRIVELGLKSFPDDYNLMADKAQALNALGRPLQAQTLLEDWMERKPHEFARGWRPVVFYAKVLEAGALEDGAEEKLAAAFENVAERAPHEDKVWSAHAKFLINVGQTEKAEAVLRRGIEQNPFSQVIHFVLGELYLRTGNAAAAVTELEKAVRYDYQDQFQPDVNPHALLCMLAQAYEANSEPAQAISLYQAVVSQGARGSILTYAQQRLRMLSALEGKQIDIPEGTSPLAQLARLLKDHHDDDDPTGAS
ncbi:hypothetical protein AGMMS50225_01030 [Betaproteobacteria bacterium]|nr:hypothetical protein AGMMS50225_01030 [Betaproteobacteria bacterium]